MIARTLRARWLLLAVATSAAALSLAGAWVQSAAATPSYLYRSLSFNGTKFCLNDPQGNTANGVQLNVWECNSGKNQLFEFVESAAEPSAVLIELVNNESKCLADPWASTQDGIKLEVYTCSDTPAFQWWLRQELSSTKVLFELRSGGKSMAFGNKDGVLKNGNPVIMWEANFGPDQSWEPHCPFGCYPGGPPE